MVNPQNALKAARRLALIMTVGALLLTGLAALGLVYGVLNTVAAGDALAALGGYGAYGVSAAQAWILMGVVAVHVGVWIALLAVARRLFQELADARPARASRTARKAAMLLWAMLAWGIFSQAIFSVAATWGYPEGERALAIAFGTPQISIAFSALIASFLAHAFALGAELWQDHKAVV